MWYIGTADLAPRILLRVALVLVAAIGLYWRQRWAWWLGLITAAWLVAGGIRAIASGQLSDLAARRPYLLLDYLYFIAGFGAGIAVVLALLTSSSRAAVRARPAAPTP